MRLVGGMIYLESRCRLELLHTKLQSQHMHNNKQPLQPLRLM